MNVFRKRNLLLLFQKMLFCRIILLILPNMLRKITINSNPVKKVGTENPTIDTNVPIWSNQEYCLYAEMTPIGTAIKAPTT